MDVLDGTYTVYHAAALSSLVTAHPQLPGSAGILVDAGMRYGPYHGDGSGVYVHASPPFHSFTVGDQWCLVELKVHPHLTRSHGRGKYVLRSNQIARSVGELCPDCQVTAILYMYVSLPLFLRF